MLSFMIEVALSSSERLLLTTCDVQFGLCFFTAILVKHVMAYHAMLQYETDMQSAVIFTILDCVKI